MRLGAESVGIACAILFVRARVVRLLDFPCFLVFLSTPDGADCCFLCCASCVQTSCMAIYERHTPETSVLYQAVARAWPGVRWDYLFAGESVAPHVESEFDRYLKCGILQHGFVRLKCKACSSTRVVGYSCKIRTFCGSCAGRRMLQTSDRLVESVWPEVPARQFVLTFPHQVRYWLARDANLLSDVSWTVVEVIREFYQDYTIRDFKLQGKVGVGDTGAVVFVQRFGSSLALNPHLHIAFMDGVWCESKSRGLEFVAYERFDTSAVIHVLEKIHEALSDLFIKRGYVTKDLEPCELELDDEEIVPPFKPRAPKAYRKVGKTGVAPHPQWQQQDHGVMSVTGWCNVRFKWFSLHAGVVIKAGDPHGLKRLFCYMARPALSVSRLSYADPDTPDESDVILQLKRPWSDGTTELQFSQAALVERLASLVPPPWKNLVRYYGVFSPGHRWRSRIVGTSAKNRRRPHDPPPPKCASVGRAPGEYWLPWDELLRRSIGVDPKICTCGGRMIVDDVITDAEGIAKMMAALGLSATPPPRGRRKSGSEIQYVFEE